MSEGPAHPTYTAQERFADGVVHGLGLTLAAAGLPWLVWRVGEQAKEEVQTALALYALGAALMLSCSALYNMTLVSRHSEWFRRFDHAAIFIMIAGTYSPLIAVGIEPPLGSRLFGFEWGLALIGASCAILFPRRGERLFIALYLLMGWAILIAVEPLHEAVGFGAFVLIVAGGLIYTAGIILHTAHWLRYHNALWHVCVLGAAICHYIAILTTVGSA